MTRMLLPSGDTEFCPTAEQSLWCHVTAGGVRVCVCVEGGGVARQQCRRHIQRLERKNAVPPLASESRSDTMTEGAKVGTLKGHFLFAQGPV